MRGDGQHPERKEAPQLDMKRKLSSADGSNTSQEASQAEK